MSRILKFLLAANLIVLAVLVFVYPHLMVGPGKLIPGHKQLETDCFACHAPLLGADSRRCLTCHKPEEIGRSDHGRSSHRQTADRGAFSPETDQPGVCRLP